MCLRNISEKIYKTHKMYKVHILHKVQKFIKICIKYLKYRKIYEV